MPVYVTASSVTRGDGAATTTPQSRWAVPPNHSPAFAASSDGGLYYIGFALGNGLSVQLDKVLRYNNGYTVNNVDTQYTVTADMLEIDQGSSMLTREPMIEYWSAEG